MESLAIGISTATTALGVSIDNLRRSAAERIAQEAEVAVRLQLKVSVHTVLPVVGCLQAMPTCVQSWIGCTQEHQVTHAYVCARSAAEAHHS